MDMGVDEPRKNCHASRPHDLRPRRFRESPSRTHFQDSGSPQENTGSDNGSSPGSVNEGPSPDPDQVGGLLRGAVRKRRVLDDCEEEKERDQGKAATADPAGVGPRPAVPCRRWTHSSGCLAVTTVWMPPRTRKSP